MNNDMLEEAIASVTRVQNFDPDQLPRRAELGSAMSFDQAVEPARRLIGLFSQIPTEHLRDLPENVVNIIKEHANSVFSTFQSILDFSPDKVDNPSSNRTQLIDQLTLSYEQIFRPLHPYISYLASRQRDFGALEREARAAVQAASDQASRLMEQLGSDRQEAERILTEVRQVAAEQGVSQQAIYFREESEKHDEEAKVWQRYTISTAAGLVIYAILSVAFYKVEFLVPENNYEAIQLSIGKFLIFAVVAYMLVLCARNFLSHKHNSIVNKHRQNALLTFNALAEASRGDDKRDIVLTHAAACIFSPQETGYTKQSGSGQEIMSTKLIEVLPKIGGGSAHS